MKAYTKRIEELERYRPRIAFKMVDAPKDGQAGGAPTLQLSDVPGFSGSFCFVDPKERFQ